MRNLIGITAALALFVAPAWADAFIPGDFNGWDSGIPMTETSAGYYEYDIPVQGANERKQFVLLATAGDWNTKYIPSGDQWCHTDGTGNLHITFDTNTHADDWFPVANRVGVSFYLTDWTAVGDWQGFDNANAATHMADMGGGIYKHDATGLSVGWHEYKAVRTGTWDAIGGDSRSVNADTFWFEVFNETDLVSFWVDAGAGVVKVVVIPEPASLALLALGGLLAIRRR